MKRLITVTMCISIALAGALTCSTASAEPKKKKNQPTPVTDPLYSLTLMRQGVVLMQQGRYDNALERFNEADRIAPESTLFLPGFAAPIRDTLAEQSGRSVTVGPVCAAELPLFFGEMNWKVA